MTQPARFRNRGLLLAIAAMFGGPALSGDHHTGPKQRKEPRPLKWWQVVKLTGGRIAVETRQIKRARTRDQAMRLASDQGLTHRQAKRNRARNKAESQRERRGVS